jgi:5-formyltetrahydrofolate cyclo-ligase
MARVNLSEMSVEALMDLRKRVDEMLLKRRAELENQQSSLTQSAHSVRQVLTAYNRNKAIPLTAVIHLEPFLTTIFSALFWSGVYRVECAARR